MPFYELSLITKNLSKPETKLVLKRAAEAIINAGAILRKIETVGLARNFPYKMSKDGVNYKQGRFHSHSNLLEDLKDVYRRDIDVIHCHITRIVDPLPFTCTLHEELKPPAYRPEVLKMIEDSQKNKKPIPWRFRGFEMNVDIYPFQ